MIVELKPILCQERPSHGWSVRGKIAGRHGHLDGRASASVQERLHSQSGFTTGTWDGDILTAYTTHMLTGYLRRNGAMTSDQATITTHFIRHGDMLTLAAQLEDPIYLTEPYYITRTFVASPTVINSAGMPCIPGDEGVAIGTVPHYLPGAEFAGDRQNR